MEQELRCGAFDFLAALPGHATLRSGAFIAKSLSQISICKYPHSTTIAPNSIA